jgi:hypothetical protein
MPLMYRDDDASIWVNAFCVWVNEVYVRVDDAYVSVYRENGGLNEDSY